MNLNIKTLAGRYKILLTLVFFITIAFLSMVYLYKQFGPIPDQVFGDNKTNTFYVENQKVYYNGRELDADARTFKHLAGSYGADKEKVFNGVFLVNKADVETFEVLDNDYYTYAKDKNHVYYNEYIFSNDPDNFVFLDKRHSKDSEYVFIDAKKVKRADPETFEIIEDVYSKDKNNIYYFGSVIDVKDPETFQIMENALSRDKDNVYYGASLVQDADPETFQILENGYLKDSENVFDFSLQKLEGFDAQTFEVIGTACSVERSFTSFVKDKNGVYFNTIKISDDPDNFEVIDTVFSGGEIPTSGTVARDSNDWYLGCGHRLVTETDLDISSLEYLSDSKFTDGNNVYYFEKVRLEENSLYTRDVIFKVHVVE